MNRRLSTILFIAFVVAAISSYLVYRIAANSQARSAGPKISKDEWSPIATFRWETSFKTPTSRPVTGWVHFRGARWSARLTPWDAASFPNSMKANQLWTIG